MTAVVELARIPSGSTCVIHSAPDLDERVARRLAVMGLVPGTEVLVVSRASGGARVLGIGATRLGIDAHLANSVLVEPPDRDLG